MNSLSGEQLDSYLNVLQRACSDEEIAPAFRDLVNTLLFQQECGVKEELAIHVQSGLPTRAEITSLKTAQRTIESKLQTSFSLEEVRDNLVREADAGDVNLGPHLEAMQQRRFLEYLKTAPRIITEDLQAKVTEETKDSYRVNINLRGFAAGHNFCEHGIDAYVKKRRFNALVRKKGKKAELSEAFEAELHGLLGLQSNLLFYILSQNKDVTVNVTQRAIYGPIITRQNQFDTLAKEIDPRLQLLQESAERPIMSMHEDKSSHYHNLTAEELADENPQINISHKYYVLGKAPSVLSPEEVQQLE